MTDRLYFEPESVEEAVGLLEGEAEGADVVAGGTDLVVAARSGRRPLGERLLAIHRVYELRGIGERPDGGLHVRALTTHAELESSAPVIERWTALADSAALVGSPATRAAGTLGGNLANGSPAMETGSPLLVFDGVVELVSRRGRRDVPIAEFLRGPGETALGPGELVIGVVLPPPPVGRVGSAYLRLEYRRAMEIAVVGAAALVALDDAGAIVEARLALTAVAPVCVRVHEAEALLAGNAPDDRILGEAATRAAAAARPVDDVRASAAYRSAMVPVIVRRALRAALRRAAGEEVAVPAQSGDGS